MSSRGRLPSGTEIGEGGYHGETYGAEHENLAYTGLGDTVTSHSRAVSTTPSACCVLCALNHLSFFLSSTGTCYPAHILENEPFWSIGISLQGKLPSYLALLGKGGGTTFHPSLQEHLPVARRLPYARFFRLLPPRLCASINCNTPTGHLSASA